MKKVKIYLAGPLGFSEVGNKFMYEEIIPIIEKLGYIILNPWKLTDQRLINSATSVPYGEARRNQWNKVVNPIIGKNNEDAIRQSTGLVAVLDGTDVDSGTAAEVGFASALKKPTLGYRGDFRLASDNEGCIINFQVEYFIYSRGGKIITQIKELEPELKKLFG